MSDPKEDVKMANEQQYNDYFKTMMARDRELNLGDPKEVGLTAQEKANIVPDQPTSDNAALRDASRAALASQDKRPDNSTPSIAGDALMKGTLAGMASASPAVGAVVGGGALIQGLFAQHAAEKAAEEALKQKREDARRLALQSLEAKRSDDMSSVIQDMLASSRAALLRR